MIVGLSSMLIYYRFFHPAGPIKFKNVRKSVDFEQDLAELRKQNENKKSGSPDFVVYATQQEACSSPIR